MTSLRSVVVGLGLASLLISTAAKAGDPDSLQARIFVSAITYDDGFGTPLQNPAGIWCDRQAGEVFVTDAGNSRVVIYDQFLNGKYSFRHFVEDPATHAMILGEPKGLAVNRQGEMLLIDSRTDRLDLLDFRGHLIDWCQPNRLLGDSTLRARAVFVTIDDNDQFYLLITGDVNRVLVIGPDLKLVRQFGESGNLPSQFSNPLAVGVHNGQVYVGDLYGTPAVKIFDTTGQFLFGFAGHDIQRQDLTFTAGFGYLDDGSGGEYLLIADALRQTVKVYTTEGEFFTMIGGIGNAPGLVQYPSGLASESPTSFYVVERVGGRVQRYEIR